MHILHVVGARPNFMKAAPVLRALAPLGFRQTLIHTGQHYDASMSSIFFQELAMPQPDLNLEVGSGTHAQQTAEIMSRFEPALLRYQPDLVLVYGDVNSTLAAALVCSKLGVRVGHVEAGLRSRDRTMPEEINRLLTDQISDLLFTPSADADENLRLEGIPPDHICLVGNVMIDTLVRLLPQARKLHVPNGCYALVTLHRPSNVDDIPWLRRMLQALSELSNDLAVVFPVHPRTRQRILELKLESAVTGGFQLVEPKPYLEFLALQSRAAFVITDSGGIQEETTYLNIPCLTVRENTERPLTITRGTNVLVGRNLDLLQKEIKRILSRDRKNAAPLPLWDGHSADRIAAAIAKLH